ncbi:MAG TPA: Na+-dependent transporter [Pseudolabrys sp.]|nr:Na+-dependent transporter [Pseudolabrys sp.]
MNVFRPFAAALNYVGRHGTLMVAASLFVGLGLPDIAAYCKPVLGPAIIAMLTLAFLRVDPAELRGHWDRPGLIAAASIWVMLVTPAVLGLLFEVTGLNRNMPGLYFMLVLQMSAPGLTSAPALAALIGLDVALTLATLIVCMALTPLTASLFTHYFLGAALPAPVTFGVRLFLLIAGCAAAAAVIRRLAGRDVIERQREAIDGLSVLSMFVFVIAAMDGVFAATRSNPLLVVGLTLLTFVLALGMMAVTALVFRGAGRARALAIGLNAGNRNIGIMLAAVGFHVPDVAWLYFGLAQFPIYLLPHLLKPLARRLNG